MLRKYANSRTLDFACYSEYHMRISDGGFICLDCWTTGKYWVKQTDYVKLTDAPIVERGGETGWLPTKYKELVDFMDKLFYAADLVEATA